MKKTRQYLAMLLVFAMLLADSSLAAWADNVFTMPASLETIEEEAFYGDQSIDKVVLSDNVTTIGPRAFADSSLTEINLPGSITYIDPSAFDGPDQVTVTADPNTYAYDWAVTNHYIDENALQVRVVCDAESAVPEESVTWTAEGVNGVEPYKYRFDLYCNGERVAYRAYSTDNTYIYKFTKTGTYHVTVNLKDDDGVIAETTSSDIIVSAENLKIDSIVCDLETIRTTDTVTWNAVASGGEQPYRYSYTLKHNNEILDVQDYSIADTYSYTFDNEGNYTLEVTVKDNLNDISAVYIVPIEVTLHPLEITDITADVSNAVTDSTITWTVSTLAGKAPFSYHYEVKLDGVSVAEETNSDSNTFTYHTENIGSCVLTVTVTDSAGNQAQQDSAEITITAKDLTIDTFTAEREWVKVGDKINWSVNATGGLKPLKYAFDVYINGEEMDGRAFNTANTYSYTPTEPGEYTARVRVRDAANTTIELTGAAVHVYDEISIVDITPDKSTVQTGEVVTWTSSVTGGKGEITYDWYIYNGDTLEYTEQTTHGSVIWTPLLSGTYTAKVVAKDEEGESAELTGGSVGCSTHPATPVSDFEFKILNGTYCSITGYTGTDSTVIIPGEWTDSNGVTRIVQTLGDNAFSNKKSITSVYFADSIETMGSSVFSGCSSLVYVKGGTKLKSVGNYAFSNCVNLRRYDFEPETISLGDYAFSGCIGLSSIYLPDSITYLGNYVFNNCSNLRSVNYPMNWTNGGSPFINCQKLVSITVPEGVTAIPADAFSNAANLVQVDLPSTLTNLGNSVFSNCSGLRSITIPDGVTVIPSSAFSSCTGLTSIDLPDGLLQIKDFAFSGCTGLSSINLPDSVTYLGNYVFRNCSDLRSITIPDGVTVIPSYAFSRCTGLTSIDLLDGLLQIKEYAFSGCTGLSSINLPDSVTYLGNYVFDNCSNLRSVNYPMNWTNGGSPFINCQKLVSITVPEGVTAIPADAFSNAANLVQVDLPSTLTNLGNSVFSNCSGLRSITIPDGVTVIPSSAFSSCTGLTSIDLPDGLLQIKDYAFSGCTGLSSIYLPDSITYLGNYVFNNCSNLRSVNYPMSWTNGGSPFRNCDKLVSITVPEGVTAIPEYAFNGCNSLLKIFIPRSVTAVADSAFYDYNSDLVIYGYAGSFIETWCANNGIEFRSDLSGFDHTIVSASVFLDSGNGLQGVTVSIYEDDQQNYLCASTTTDENGTWSWNGALLGYTYWIHLSMDGYSFSSNDFAVYIDSVPMAAKSVRALYGGAPETVLSLSEDEWSAYSDGGMKLLTINSSNGWYITESPDWIELYVQETAPNGQLKASSLLRASTTYSANQELLISLGENTTGNQRNGVIGISNGELDVTFNISQESEEQVVGVLSSVEFLTQSPYAVNETVGIHVSASAFQQGVVVVTSDVLPESSVTYFTSPEYDFTYLAKQAGEYDVYIGVTTTPEGIQYEEYGLNLCTDYQNLSFTVLNESYDFGGMAPSEDLISFLTSYDSFHSTYYYDSNGKPTIGYGHNYSSVSEFDEPISEELARQLLWGDVASKCRIVNSRMKQYGITLTQQQFDAFVSMAYNGASGISQRSDIRLWNYYNEYGSFSAIPPEKVMESFVTWHKCSNKSMLFGLYRRRCDEAQIFIYGEYQKNSPSQPDWMAGIEPTKRSDGGYSYDVPDGWVSPLIGTADYVRLLSGDAVELARTATSNQTLRLSSSKAWTAVASENWIAVSNSGSQNASLTYSVQANTDAAQRQGTITITSGSESAVFTITQHGTQSDTMSLSIDCKNVYNAGDTIFSNVQVNGGSGSYRYSYYVYKFEGTTWTLVGSNALIPGTGKINIIKLETLAAGSYKIVFQARDYDGAIAENCAYITVKQSSMGMVQPNTAGVVIPGTGDYKLEWTSVENADDYVLRIRSLTTGDMVIGDEAGDGVHTGNDTYFSISNTSSIQQQVLRIWIGAYKNNVLIGQTQTIATVGPIQQISFNSPEENAYVASGEQTISWDAFSDGQNTVALYRISVRDITSGESGPLIVDNVNLRASITSYSLTITAGHKYRAWIGAFTQDGGRIAQKELLFHSISESQATEGINPALVIQQCSDTYKTIKYGSSSSYVDSETVGWSGCGLVAVVNAFVYKSQNTSCAESLIRTLASTCVSKGQYTYSSLKGTIENVFSDTLNISTSVTYDSSKVKKHVQNGGVAILGSNISKLFSGGSSSPHFVAIVSYRTNGSNQYEYLLLDSAIITFSGSTRNPLYTNASGWGWITSDQLDTIMNAANLVSFTNYTIKQSTDDIRMSVTLNGKTYTATKNNNTGITVTAGSETGLWPSVSFSTGLTRLEVALFDGGGYEVPIISYQNHMNEVYTGSIGNYVVEGNVDDVTNPYVPGIYFPEDIEAGTYWLTVIAENASGHKEIKIQVTVRLKASTITVLPSSQLSERFTALETKLPNLMYWNHHCDALGNLMDNTSVIEITGVNGDTMTTWISTVACTGDHHSWEADGKSFKTSTCNAFSMQSSGIGEAQCIGFANTIAWAIGGKDPILTSWSNNVSEVDNIAPGDMVWIRSSSSYGHKFVVLRVEDGIVYYVDCNGYQSEDISYKKCQIRWDRRTTVDDIKDNFRYIKHYSAYADPKYIK